MPRTLLSQTHDWELVDRRQDVRGRPLLGADGEPLGTIADLLIDSDEQCIVALVLEDGREYPLRDVELTDEAVVLQAAAPAGADLSTSEPGTHGAVPVASSPMGSATDDVPASVPPTPDSMVDRAEPEQRDEWPAEEQIIRIPLRVEHITLEKVPVVVEQATVRREAHRAIETISETVRREEPSIRTSGRVVDQSGRPEADS